MATVYSKDGSTYTTGGITYDTASGRAINPTTGEFLTDVKKREELIKKDNYSPTGGLPTTLRYPNTALDDEMDFLKITIAEFEPPGIKLDELVPVTRGDQNQGGQDTFGVNGSEVGNLFLDTKTNANTNVGSAGRTLKKPKHTIFLPIPRKIQDSNSVQYGDGQLNPLEALGAGIINQQVQNPDFNSLKDSIKSLISIASNQVEGNTEAIASAVSGRAIGVLGGNIRPNDLISRASGQILNPNLELLFQGVQLRRFPFQFEFFPRNPVEAKEVMMIIKVLKRSMAARANKVLGSGIFIKQPDIFQLKYMKGSEEHPFLNKFLPMHLTDMKIDYTASNTYSTFYDGTPTHMIVQCSFTEVNPVYKEDYDSSSGKGVGY